jgi:hypothetical protein
MRMKTRHVLRYSQCMSLFFLNALVALSDREALRPASGLEWDLRLRETIPVPYRTRCVLRGGIGWDKEESVTVSDLLDDFSVPSDDEFLALNEKPRSEEGKEEIVGNEVGASVTIDAHESTGWPLHANSESSSDDAPRLLASGRLDPQIAKYGWDGRAVADEKSILVDGSSPTVKATGMPVTSWHKSAGLPEAVLGARPGDRLLLPSAHYKWQLHQWHEGVAIRLNELKGYPILVPYALEFLGERDLVGFRSRSCAMEQITPNMGASLLGQWLLTELPPEKGRGLWQPPLREGLFDNVRLAVATYESITNVVEARGGHWRFHRCQLRGSGGVIPLALFQNAVAKVERCAVGGTGDWGGEACCGAVAYEQASLNMCRTIVEWTKCEGAGLRAWDSAILSLDRGILRYNGCHVLLSAEASVSLSRCVMYGAETAGISAVGEVGQASLNLTDCTYYGESSREGAPQFLRGEQRFAQGALHVQNLTKNDKAVLRPRTWRPIDRLDGHSKQEFKDLWSSSDSDCEGHPYPMLDIDEFEQDLRPEPSLDHLAIHMQARDEALAKELEG